MVLLVASPGLRSAARAAGLVLMLALGACTARPLPPPVASGKPPAQCLAQLDRLGVRYEIAPQPAGGIPACFVADPVRVTAATIPWSRPALAACDFVLAFDRFETQALRPLARRYFGEDVKLIEHFGTYDCRTTDTGRPSAHARGLAMDLAGVELADGRQVLVEKDWRPRDSRGRFLHALAAAACRYFNEVLDPDSDRDHWNHIHLDLGPYRLCVRR
jgi:hypothetical protein